VVDALPFVFASRPRDALAGRIKSAIGGKESHERTDAAFNALIAPFEGRIGTREGRRATFIGPSCRACY